LGQKKRGLKRGTVWNFSGLNSGTLQ